MAQSVFIDLYELASRKMLSWAREKTLNWLSVAADTLEYTSCSDFENSLRVCVGLGLVLKHKTTCVRLLCCVCCRRRLPIMLHEHMAMHAAVAEAAANAVQGGEDPEVVAQVAAAGAAAAGEDVAAVVAAAQAGVAAAGVPGAIAVAGGAVAPVAGGVVAVAVEGDDGALPALLVPPPPEGPANAANVVMDGALLQVRGSRTAAQQHSRTAAQQHGSTAAQQRSSCSSKQHSSTAAQQHSSTHSSTAAAQQHART